MRYSWSQDAKVATTIDASDPIAWDSAIAGLVYVPIDSSIKKLTFYVSPELGGDYLPLYSGVSAVTLAVAAGQAFAMPEALRGCRGLKMVGDAAGTVALSLQN